MRDFRKLEVWKEGIDFCQAIYQLTSTLPKDEKYGLVSQMNRAGVSIPSNLAEGCSRKSKVEFAKYIDYSLGSAFELETQIIICSRIGHIEEKLSQRYLTRLNILQKRINASKNSIS